MPVQLNNLVNQWFTQKQVDKDGNGLISRDEMATYTNNAASKPANEQSWEEALAGKLIKSADNNGGESFFDILSKLDGVAGLTQAELSGLAKLDGNGKEVSGKDFDNFNKVTASQANPPKYQSADKPKNEVVRGQGQITEGASSEVGSNIGTYAEGNSTYDIIIAGENKYDLVNQKTGDKINCVVSQKEDGSSKITMTQNGMTVTKDIVDDGNGAFTIKGEVGTGLLEAA